MNSLVLQQIWMAALLAVSAYAVWRGGRDERIVALANVIAWGFALVPFLLLLRHIAAKLCALRRLGRSTRV